MIIWLFSLFIQFSHQITCTEGREYQNVCYSASLSDLNIVITRGYYTGDVFIPTEIDLGIFGNIGIQIINSNAFTGTPILSVSLPEELRTIQDGAFSNCPNLHTVTFRAPSRDIMIGASAFQGCTALASIIFTAASSMTFTLGRSAFYGCTSLQILDFRPVPRLDTIAESAFENCVELVTVLFSAFLTISSAAFRNCVKLDNLDLTYVQNIYEYAFDGCSMFYASNGGVVTFYSIQNIGSYAFTNCISFREIHYLGATVLISNDISVDVFPL